MRFRPFTSAILCLAAMSSFSAPAIIPQPDSVAAKSGFFVLDKLDSIQAFGPTLATANHCVDFLRPILGKKLPIRAASGTIQFVLDPKLKPAQGEEGYVLSVKPKAIRISAATSTGLFYGLQSLKQLVPAAQFLPSKAAAKVEIPCVEIKDRPRFGWRGTMLDVARHFMPKEDVKRFIDLMAFHKLNVFHWHLTEDQGWRIEIKKYPKLTQIGAWRKETIIGRQPGNPKDFKFDGQRHGGFYTQEDVKEIVAYAAARHITIVPEIEMPGHAQAAIAAYPALGNTGAKLEPMTFWGVNPNILNAEDSTIKFMQDVLTEVLALFPSKFIHIGGDEAPKEQWDKSPAAQAKIKALGLKDSHELQSWFIKQMDTWLDKRGRRLIGWDEILEGGLAPGATVMSWRGVAGGIQAAKMGHDVVMAPTTYTYLDYYQSRNMNTEPVAIGGYLPLRTVYSYDPTNIPELTPEQAKKILGVQAQLWTEYMKDMRKVEYMAYPRLCAIAEIGWSQQNDRNYSQFLSRLKPHLTRLDALGINYRELDEFESAPIGSWKAGEVSNDFQVKTWDMTKAVPDAGDYRIVFQYTRGGHRLDIEWIEVLVNDKVLVRTEKLGITGLFNRDNEYPVKFATLPKGAKITLRASVRGDGGGDSNGDITLAWTPR